MNTETNHFEYVPEPELKKKPEKYIEFVEGERCVIKGYYFMIEKIEVNANRLILLPVGLVQVAKK